MAAGRAPLGARGGGKRGCRAGADLVLVLLLVRHVAPVDALHEQLAVALLRLRPSLDDDDAEVLDQQGHAW